VFVLVVLVQIAVAESNHAAGTPPLLVVAVIIVRAPLISGVTWVPHEVMLPSILTQLLRIGTTNGDTNRIEVVDAAGGVGETAVDIVLANAPEKLRPITAIAARRIAAIIVLFLMSVFILTISSF